MKCVEHVYNLLQQKNKRQCDQLIVSLSAVKVHILIFDSKTAEANGPKLGRCDH